MTQKTPNYITKLRNSNLRPTKQRIKICEVLFNRPKTFHFTINNLYKLLSDNSEKKISLATVYNTIHAFKKSGYLKQVNIDSSITILIQIHHTITIFLMKLTMN